LRKEENIRFAEKLGMPFIDADYNKDEWFARIKGQEDEPAYHWSKYRSDDV
jgi:predicted adenine nucleotide alpha hydrolase (AANH) superfamily ATPase